MNAELVVVPDDLIRLAAKSDCPAREGLKDAIRRNGQHLRATSRVSAPQLLRIYQVRLQRWKDEGIPVCVGMPEFVAALEGAGKAAVVVARYSYNEQAFVVLLSGELDAMLGCIAICHPRLNANG